MKRFKWAVIVSVVMIGATAGLGVGQQQVYNDYVEQLQNGSIDWGRGVIRATGSGAPSNDAKLNTAQRRLGAERAALADAYRNILEAIKGVRVDSETLVENFVVESDRIRTQVNGFVRGARFVPNEDGEKYTYLSDGSIEITLEMPLFGPSRTVSSVIVPEQIQAAALKPAPRVQVDSARTPDTSGIITGLVIDARGLGVRPAMSPKIITRDGREVYGSAYVDRDWAIKQGMAGYVKDLDSAMKNRRIMDNNNNVNPLVVKGVRASGNRSSDIEVTDDDAQRILKLDSNLKFLKQTRVLIVVD